MAEASNRISTLARRGLLPLSVAALLAFALVPGVAVAEVGIPQYRDAPPTVTGETRDADPNTGSNTGGDDGDAGQSPTGGGSNDGAGSKDGGGDEQGGAAGGDGKGDGKGGSAGIGDGKELDDGSASPQAIDSQNASSDSGGSPLVPILIALAVLAAISVGVVAMRKKREDADPGAPASPEAG